MTEESLEREISRDEAIEALTSDTRGPERVSEDHELSRIHLGAENYDEGLIWDSKSTFTKHQRDEAIVLLYELVESWADEKGYDLVVENKSYWDQPLNQDLFQGMHGYIEIEGEEYDFDWWTSHQKISADFFSDNSMDASMSDEYREIYSLAESALDDFGRVTETYPHL